ncbi:MAG TPA: Gfo/Idh/MocA family oxidoreductase [Pseudonocardiaceae bacterium]|nr:Gfo/Idh/MocA family oxidoreductase [Pseudonocardiaceae bacterium]
MVESRLRIGLIGAGPWACQVHAPGIANHPGTRLVAVYSRRAGAAAELAEQHGARVADDPTELISQVDAVALAVPPAVQAEYALLAAKAGKHLILEKPVAATLDDARRLADAIADAGVASLVVLTRRFAPETIEWLASARQRGAWAGGDARWYAGALLSGRYSGSAWRHAGGALMDVGPHVLDLLDAALGEIVEVLAAHRGEATDLWHLVLAHEGGATSTASLSLRLPINPPVVETSIYGEHGLLMLSGRDSGAADCFAALLDDLLTMVATGITQHACDVRRGVHLQRVIELANLRANQ